MTEAPQHHPHIAAFLDWLRASGRWSTARTYDSTLARLTRWLAEQGIDAARATTDDLAWFQRWLAETYRGPRGSLAKTTQAGVMANVRSVYHWMRRRGLILHDPAEKLAPAKIHQPVVVAKDHLTQQEAVALVETLAFFVEQSQSGTTASALAQRNLALVAVALASGRRCHGLIALRVDHLDLERRELRVDHEKGKTGRVLPIAGWAVAAVRQYLDDGRVMLLRGGTSDRLFLSQRRGHLCHKAIEHVFDQAVAATTRRNPDLVDLPVKRITTHSLRVSFATLLFQGGCNIRSLNEMMLHSSLTTTARYTPIGMNDLRRALLAAHPRA